MTRQEAIQAMRGGLKVTHRLFSEDEWITMQDGKIVDEKGYRFPPHEFWRYRTSNVFGQDWEIKD